ncbi:hypothetical protein [Mycobacterium camsae]|uniref:hypothetical protein n=1 Tax=Mycobacterium gordonae TaxID=1778 RepID=UPI00197E3407|nr:hypothetical protein [Mycobacterium gordonae]
MDRPAANSSQADCALRLITQICKRTNLQMDIYQRAIVVAEQQGRPDQVRELRRFLGMQRQDRNLLRELLDRDKSAGVPAGKPSVCDEGSRGWHCRWRASRRRCCRRAGRARIALHRSKLRNPLG